MTAKKRVLFISVMLLIICAVIYFSMLYGELSDYRNGGFRLKGTYQFVDHTNFPETRQLIFTGEKGEEGYIFEYYRQYGIVETGVYTETDRPNLYKLTSGISDIMNCHVLAGKESICTISNDTVIRYEKVADVRSYANVKPPGERYGKFVMNTFSTPIEDGRRLGGLSGNAENLYFALCKSAPDAEFNYESIEIVEQLSYGTQGAVYSYDNPEGFMINEIKATQDSLFWVRREDGNTSVEKLDIVSGTLSTVHEINAGNPIDMETDGRYLIWFDENEIGEVNLFVYDTREDEINSIDIPGGGQLTQCRPYIVNGRTTFCVRNEDTQEQEFKVYDIESASVVKSIPMSLWGIDKPVKQCAATDKYLCFSVLDGKGEDQNIYSINYSEDAAPEIISSDYVFSFQILGDTLFINESDGILPYSLSENKEFDRIYQNYTEGGGIIFDKAIFGQYYIAWDSEYSTGIEIVEEDAFR